jgi:hypothetical protein
LFNDYPAVPTFDADALARRTYLRTDEAAFYLGYTTDRYRDPRAAFMEAVRRLGPRAIPRLYQGRRVLFSRRDLDRLLRPRNGPEAGS